MIEVLDRPAAGPVIRLHEADNVVIARSNVEIGAKLGDGLTCRCQVPSGHKIAPGETPFTRIFFLPISAAR